MGWVGWRSGITIAAVLPRSVAPRARLTRFGARARCAWGGSWRAAITVCVSALCLGAGVVARRLAGGGGGGVRVVDAGYTTALACESLALYLKAEHA